MDCHISAQAKNVIRAHFIELAERFQMTLWELIDSFYVSGIDLLSGIQKTGDLGLIHISDFS